uniref:capsular polysaccharide biosynthesis protein n=1 Tax=Orrella sp. TaxID=1921583 RepID=UPI004047310B
MPNAPVDPLGFFWLRTKLPHIFARMTTGTEIVLVGWGRRPSAVSAVNLAQRHGLRYQTLEDGFLRSYGTGQHFPPIALIEDSSGIYYDSRNSSDLEDLLNSEAELLELGTSGGTFVDSLGLNNAFEQIVREGLSKYNHSPLFNVANFEHAAGIDEGRIDSFDGGSLRILVIDQTKGDLSVVCGGAGAETFEVMLQAALNEHPDATVFVKTHPEVSSGRKSGYLTETLDRYAARSRVVVLRETVEPAGLLRAMDQVYVVSSTMGFEALMHGKTVTCFGMPWYAGWGVTDDRLVCARRTRRRSVRELFAAAYVAYTTYMDPVTHGRGSIHDAIDWLVHQKTMAKFLHGDNLAGRVFVYGLKRWKAYNLKAMLALKPEQLIFVDGVKALIKYGPVSGDTVMVWGADLPLALAELIARLKQEADRGAHSVGLSQSGLRVLHVEDGFLRSVGLGSDMIKPQSLVFDTRGLYFDARKPSDLEHLLQNMAFSEEELLRAANIRRLIVEHGLTKYNLEVSGGVQWQRDGQQDEQYLRVLKSNSCVIFVPGQVEDDASIRYGCVDVRTNLGLLKAVRASNPKAWIVYKPHPDVVSGNRVGKVPLNSLKGLVDHVETAASVIDCIFACDEVHTMTSLTGFDALLRGKRVVTYGQPFYAGWGLTEDRCVVARTMAVSTQNDKLDGAFGNHLDHESGVACDQGFNALKRRTRRLSLDELVAGALLRYPIYLDEKLRGYTTCEAVINRLVEERGVYMTTGGLEPLRVGYAARAIRKIKVLLRAWVTRL